MTFETPLSGMSMNPARTFCPAAYGGYWHTFWIYLIAPTVGMLAAAEMFLRMRRGVAPYCAKLHHANDERCIFHHTPRLHNTSSSGGGMRQFESTWSKENRKSTAKKLAKLSTTHWWIFSVPQSTTASRSSQSIGKVGCLSIGTTWASSDQTTAFSSRSH